MVVRKLCNSCGVYYAHPGYTHCIPCLNAVIRSYGGKFVRPARAVAA